jgi:hypothetical protein
MASVVRRESALSKNLRAQRERQSLIFPASNMEPPPTIPTDAATAAAAVTRTSLNGCWMLDKTKLPWSIQDYLTVMNVDQLAIAAHEKGEQEHDTFHTIHINNKNKTVQIIKRSRVNNDLVVDLSLGQEYVEHLSPHDRPKRMIAVSDHPGHLCIRSSIQTMNGTASVTDIKRLVEGRLVQELTVVNQETGATHTTTRHFLPYDGVPPHLVVTPAGEGDAAAIAAK